MRTSGGDGAGPGVLLHPPRTLLPEGKGIV